MHTAPHHDDSDDNALPAESNTPAYLTGLNPAQRRAIEALDGPVLVLAGAGTGKTRVLTSRLVHLLMTGRAVPGQILAVTFTNKAAGEVRERISHMLGRSVDGWYLGTFHSLAARLLRPHAELVGLKPNFTILDTDDQIRLLKQLLEAHGVDDKKSPARLVVGIISRWKDRGLLPDDVKGESGELAGGKLPRIYAEYQERLIALNACDFGDLLLHHLTILRKYPDILADMHARFHYILVDEYQDTNVVQYLWLRLLAQGHKNICCVGDEDQSIYGWRGAEIGNILRFEEDFPGAQVVRLEQNYRSTGHILGAAAGLIEHNSMRLGKTLWTSAEPGERVQIRTLWDGEEEARWVGDEIETLQRRGVPLSDIAVMVRAGFQTRQFEERFITLGIPYRVLVGARFYERAEIRDALAYFRLLASPEDDLAFERIVNVPKRGVGPAAIQKLHNLGRAERIPLTESTARLTETSEFGPKLRETLRGFLGNFLRWRELLKTIPHAEVAQIVLDESGYTGMWQADKSPEAPGKLDNLKELVSAMAEFDTLGAFLEHVSLVLETTSKSDGEQVTLMTLHGAKGLEYNAVFLPGWEEEIFPSRRSIDENGNKGLEEERRLAYVGITRARVRAMITHVANRHLHGSWINALPSRFLAELPEAHVERHSAIGNAQAGRSQVGGGFGGGGYSSGYGSGRSWEHEENKRPPTLWEQLNAGRSRLNSAQQPAKMIEGTATVVQSPKREGKLNVGDRVMHEKFGTGTIRRIDHDKLDVAFDKAGTKKILENFVKLAE